MFIFFLKIPKMLKLYDKYGNFLVLSNNNLIDSNVNKKNDCVLRSTYTKNFLLKSLIKKQKKARCVCVAGHLHHGKSTFINVISSNIHLVNQSALFDDFSSFFYLEKQISTTHQLSVFNFLLCDINGKSRLLTLIDCPGHFEFFDQTLAGMKVSEGMLLIIDVSEGISIGTEFYLKNSIVESLPTVVILNSIDRLILEYGLSVLSVQKKLISILDELNSIIEESIFKKKHLKKKIAFFNPVENNVCFGSFLQGWSFTLRQYSEMYISCQPSVCLSIQDLSSKLWNNFYYKKNFLKNSLNLKKKTMFIEFVLEPLYKLNFLILGEPIIHIQKFTENELGISGKKKAESPSGSAGSFDCFVVFFGGCRWSKLISNHTGLVLSIVEHIPPFEKSHRLKGNFIRKNYISRFLGYAYKLYPVQNKSDFLSLVRVLKGSVFKKMNILIATEGHEFYADEFFYLNCTVKNMYLPMGHYNLELSLISSNLIILIKGISRKVRKTAILFKNTFESEIMKIFFISLLRVVTSTVSLCNFLSILIEPVNFHHINRFYDSLQKSSKVYTRITHEKNQSGKFFLYGTGELHLDCVVYDIKFIFEKFEINISNPFFFTKQTVNSEKKYTKVKFSNKMEIKVSKSYNTYNQIDLWSEYKKFPVLRKNTISNYWKNFKKCIDSGGFMNKVEKKYNMNKIKTNTAWILGPISSLYSCCLLNKHNVKKKHNFDKNTITTYFDSLINENHSTFLSLHELELEIKEINKKNIFVRKSFHELFLKNRIITHEPSFVSQITINPEFLSTTIKNIKLNGGCILSSNFFFRKNTFDVKFIISWKNSIGLEFKFRFLVARDVNFYFLFDGWKKVF